MKDVVVIGAGFWGAAISRKLGRAKLTYTVIDNELPIGGSRNSGAYTCLRWFSSGTVLKQLQPTWTKDRIEHWVNWLIRQGYLESVGQWVYNKRLDTWKRYDDCYIMKDVNAFTNKTKNLYHDRVTHIKQKDDYCQIYMNASSPVKARHIVLATGAWTDNLLSQSGMNPIGVEGLNGRAIIVEPEFKVIKKRIEWAREVISVSVRPFKNYDLLPNSKKWWYFGATTEKTESQKAFDEMIGAAKLVLGPDVRIRGTVTGVRPIFGKGVVKVSERIIAATGGGRIGLALAGPAADDCIRLLKESM